MLFWLHMTKPVKGRWQKFLRSIFDCPHHIPSHENVWCECSHGCIVADMPKRPESETPNPKSIRLSKIWKKEWGMEIDE